MRASEVALFKNTVYELYYMFGLRLDLFLVDLSNYIWLKNVDKTYHMKTKGLFSEL